MTEKKTVRILALGAGVQSTALLLKSYYGELPMLDCAIFSDTQAEPEKVYKHLEFLEKLVGKKIPIIRTTLHSLEWAVTERRHENGRRFQPVPFFSINGSKVSMLFKRCTSNYKIIPLSKVVRKLLGLKKYERAKDKVAEVWLGISMDEIIRMKPSRIGYIKHTFPLIENSLTRNDCLKYLKKLKIKTPKSACYFCPYRNNKGWLDFKLNYPSDWEKACSFDEKIRENPEFDGKLYIHRSGKPLRDIDFGKQMMLGGFEEECEGYCGI